MRSKIAVLGSGNGTNFEVIAQKIIQNKIKNADIVLVFSNQPDAKIIEKAQRYNIKTYALFAKKSSEITKEYNQILLKVLKENQVDYIVLAGYMLTLDSLIIDAYWKKIINIHPSYLPHFKGYNAIKKSYNSKSKFSGITIHYVNKDIDDGEVIFQKKLKINRKWDLDKFTAKIHRLEYKYYSKIINKIINRSSYE